MVASLIPQLASAKVLWTRFAFLVAVTLLVDGETRYIMEVTDEQELVVREAVRDTSAAGDGAVNLQEALDQVSARGIRTLVFEAEEYEFQTALVIRRTLTITSRIRHSTKARLSCREANQIFKVERTSENVIVELRNVRITNCTTLGPDGVIHVGSGIHVVFSNVELVNNKAEGINDSIVVADSNATLAVRGNSSFSNNRGRVMLIGNGSEVIIENSTFSHNTAETNGTVLSTKPGGGIQLNIRDSFFEGNEARGSSGGVMWLETSSMTLENGVQFISNVADHDGGALYLNNSPGLRVSDTKFQNNSCHLGKGGAVFIVPSNDSNTRIRRSIFKKNSANGAMGIGGAIAFGNTTINSTRQLELGSDVLFLKNTARVSGGAVIVYETRTDISALSVFIGNSAQGAAGGLHMFSSETGLLDDGYINARISDASFISNRAPHRGGGAIVLAGDVHMTMSNSTCSTNSGRKGGAMRIRYARNVVLRGNCRFERNKATERGGSVHIRGSNITMTYSWFFENEGERGGSISVEDGEVFYAENCTFEGNKASIGGGAIDLENLEISRGQDTKATLQNTVFRNNTSFEPRGRGGFGGAMRLTGAGIYTRVIHCLLENNAAHLGGSLYLDEAYRTALLNTNFSKNTASLGGALYIVPLERELHGSYDSTNLRSCLLRENMAARGGAIFARPARLYLWKISEVSNSLLSIEDSIFLRNRANDTGGAVFLALMNASFTGCLFRHNRSNRVASESTASSQVATTARSGGAVYATDGSYLIVSDTNFIANNAYEKGGAVCIEYALFNCTRNCTFQMNRGRNGGGIFCLLFSRRYDSNPPAVLHCYNCSFQQNNAQRGGGIYASIPRINLAAKQSQACQGSRDNENNTTETSSAGEDCKHLVLLDPTTVQDNSATITGHAIFSNQPSAIMVATEQGRMNLVQYDSAMVNEKSSNYTFASPAHKVTRSVGSLRNLNRGKTGQAFGNLEFCVLDYFNRSVRGFRIVAELWQCQGNSECCSSETKRHDAENVAASGKIIASRIATNGLVSFEGLEISDNGRGNSEFPLWVCFIDEDDDQVSLAPRLINISFRGCYTMERRNSESGGCSECDPGRYYANENGNCTNCPEHATCRGLTIIPDAGYWHATSVSDKIYKCRPREACVEDEKGYRGIAVTEAHKERRILNWTDSEYDQCNTVTVLLSCQKCRCDNYYKTLGLLL